MNDPAIRAVLFDLDDTLLDAAPAFAGALGGAVQTIVVRHPHLSPATVREAWRTVHGPLMRALDEGETTMAAVRTERFRRVLAVLGAEDDAFADEIDLALGRDQLAALRLFPDADAIESLRARGLFVGIVTNGAGDAHPDSQRTKAAHVGLIDWVDGLWISDETGHRKPDPRAFAPALAAIGCRPEEALYVGDSVTNDVVGANRAGLVSVRLLRGPDDPSAGVGEVRPAHTVASLHEIERLLA